MDALRKLLTTYAYNILGSLEDAKDAVQDAYLNFMEHDTAAIENKKAYLVRSVINISINLKNRQKRLSWHNFRECFRSCAIRRNCV